MSRRKTVQLNLPVVLPLIKKTCRSNVVFCERMGRMKQSSWVSDWQRTPAKNLPSPEEAARMCALLQVEPEDILPVPEDAALVRDLIEQERNAQKDPAHESDAHAATRQFFDFVNGASDSELLKVLDYIEFIKSQRGK